MQHNIARGHHVAVLLVALAARVCAGVEEERLIGWQGETHRVKDLQNEPWIETVSMHPRAVVFHNFLSHEECDHIIELAEPVMERSTVVGSGGAGVLDNIRTSSGTFIMRYADQVISDIEERIARFTHIPVAHQEDMQVLKYDIGQKYGAHYDSLTDGSPRIATVLMYLSDVEEGGETAFPKSTHFLDQNLQTQGEWSECARGSVTARPKKGDALLFFSLNSDLRQDKYSLHTGCPVVRGTKWSATAWIHTQPFRPENLNLAAHPPQAMWQCFNEHGSCEDWAKGGECEKNPTYMVGTPAKPGACRPGCGLCEECADKNDKECESSNRRKLSEFLISLKERKGGPN
mmetsp:Transcript_11598/g.32872  ORF Transcript_11598/g.32872 Transcript_11598/m.32872 type:complete len:346 (-) Transcript_11598:300-1337(-)|eukprot:CAMPEP_0117665436 /NCGR_PEP_ID=MMETSP0804-20121206/9807_1 /TAXON_ID=1074897 /ORGANISM="Tetraselmis astigmatica, Strain CCMP880" /LENGTH=345 /DNA_ID=CAMNT_0005472845 /DNA_START=267 /DNA_END=1304 /DNA_ORIENTATION=+